MNKQDLATIRFFNTESRKKEHFEPLIKGRVGMYTCGPTVYNYAHIGNFRTYVFEDVLRKSLQFFGYQVMQVMNITDVDDKTIKGALQAGIPLKEYTDPFTEAFFQDLQTLHIAPAERYPAATDYIEAMIGMIQTMLDKGSAYKGSDGSIYFSLRHFPPYGRLSHLVLDNLQKGASHRIAIDEYDKESASDFVLWKSYDEKRDGHIFWPSPFGPGRPGWHIECSAMAMSILGPSIDIHAGAVDNIFPHHENEIAQSECCSGKQFVRYWLHAEHLIVEGRKMSKSAGNFYTLRDLLKMGYTGSEVRYLLLSSHYRTQLNFTIEALMSARSSLQRLKAFVMRLEEISCKGASARSDAGAQILHQAERAFADGLADDLNMPLSLAALYDFVRAANIEADQGLLTAQDAKHALEWLQKIDDILSVLFVDKEVSVPQKVLDLVQKRQEARQAKNWQRADLLRHEVLLLGYIIEDKPDGVRIKATTS